MSENEEKKQSLTNDTLSWICKIPKDKRSIHFDRESQTHVLKLFIKDVGVCCKFCSEELDIPYFCPEENIFMCRDCCIHKHHPKTTTAHPEHYDLKVKLISSQSE